MRSFSYTILISFFISASLFGSRDTLLLRAQFNKLLLLSEEADCQRAAIEASQLLASLEEQSEAPIDIVLGLYHIRGDCALMKGQFEAAKQFFETAEELGATIPNLPPLLAAEIIHKLGNFYLETKNYGLAIPMLEEALQKRKEAVGPWHVKIADSYVNLGICAEVSGDFDKALDYHQQALAIRSDLIPDQLPKIAQCQNNIGLCYDDQQNYEASKQAYKAALQTYETALGNRHPKVADVLLNLGNVYGAEGQLDSFILFQQQAVGIWQSLYGQNHPLNALAYNNLANAYDQLGNSEQALSLFQKALAIQQNIYGKIHADVAATYFNMGLTLAWLERWEEAQLAFEQSFTALNFEMSDPNSFEQVNDPILLLRILKVAAEIPKRKYQANKNEQYLLEAAQFLSHADKLIDYLRTSYEATASKLALAQSAQAIYSDAIHLASTLGDLTQDQAYYQQAYRYAEKSKGILLLEALKKSDAASFTGVPDERLAAIKDIETEIGLMETQYFLLQQKSPTVSLKRIDSLANLLFDQKQALSDQINRLEEDYPEYYQLRYATDPPSIEWLQSELIGDNESIVEYFLGNQFLHLFVINKEDFLTVDIPVPAGFRSTIRSYNNTIRNFPFVSTNELRSNIEGYAKAAHYLYQYLVEPIKPLIKERLIIIPDEELGYLSFEALLQEMPQNLSLFKEYQYLVKQYTISYNYSTGLLKEMQERTTKTQLKPYLGFSPTFGPNHSKSLNELKYNQVEVTGIQERLGGRVFADIQATKSNFLAEQDRYKVLHLATHGKANDAYGDYSFLAFTENSEALGDQALLFVREIYNLTTHAELIVLSACETGTGELQKGEGIASIARSFSYAGAKSLVASHWSVDDKATSQLMHSFFDFIKEGYTKDQALRAAKLAFIDQGKHKDVHPFFWASFVPIGNMDQIQFANQNQWYLWGLVLVILAVLGYALRSRFQQKQQIS